MSLSRTLKVVLVAAGLVVPAGLAVPSAEAASTQTICNDTRSVRNFRVDVLPARTPVEMYIGRCESIFPRGGTVVTIGRSYRVKYRRDGKNTAWSECRSNSGFTPWSKADKITFRTYEDYDC